MILEEHDKNKFILWLSRQIESAEALERQMANLSSGPTVKDAMVRKFKLERAGCEIVKHMLESMETVTVSVGDSER